MDWSMPNEDFLLLFPLEMFSSVWGLSFFFRQNMKLKPSSYGYGQPEDLIVFCYVHEEVNTLPERCRIEQSDAHILQNAAQTD